ncbi:MAG: immunoglobulin domain-containing protein [Verrucomicrobia bacterium]|nr:immunoglobulin domain-containing protein [Verrucomicrobiota bacterium]
MFLLRPNLALLILLGTTLLAAVAPSARAQTQPSWTNVPHGLGTAISGSFGGVAAGNGVFVATGSSIVNGQIQYATSSDGVTWRAGSLTPPLTGALHTRPRFLNGRFVIFAAGARANTSTFARLGLVYHSTNGTDWTATETGSEFTTIPAEIDFGGGRYLAVAGSDIFASTDLATWTRLAAPIAGIFSYLDVAYGNGRWFVTSNGGGAVATSTDGVTFTVATGLAGALGGFRVEYGNGVWFFYSQINNAVSTDGTTFTTVVRTNTTPGGTGTIRFVNGRFLSPGIAGPFLASLDGRTWFNFGAYPAVTSIFTASYDFAFGGGKFITAGSITPSISQISNPSPVIFTLNEADAPAPAVPPSITTAPTATNAVIGGTASFSVVAAGQNNTYQWIKDTSPIAGATAATLVVSPVTAASAGNYSVRITNSLGTVTSTPVALNLVAASAAGRLVNLSVRTGAGTGDNTLIVGIGLGGAGTSGNKAVLLRGVGPTLGAFGIGGTLADPVMTVFQGQSQVATNDDWDAAAGASFASLGAFAFTAGSRDAAIHNPALPANSYSIQITGKNNGTGIALAEIYDATPSASFGATTPRLVNVSARTQVGTGDNILITGFVVGGSTPVRILLRAVGPTLASFGVGGALADPKLELFRGSEKITENDNWDAATAANFSRVGAFGFTAGSRDAALVAVLQPGSYTAQVSGVNGTTGVALVEVYELP